MAAREVIFELLRHKHTLGQMLNLAKYYYGKRKCVVNWDPIYISTFITYRCNLSCDMCLTHSTKFSNPYGQKPTKDMDFELFKQVLNRYKNALGVNIIGNGEPLLHKDFFKMVDYAANVMKMNVFSSSNGILVGNYVEEIINSPLKNLNISINGHNPAEFTRMTGMPPELFSHICDNTYELVKRKKGTKPRITACFILDRENYSSLKDIIYFADSLGTDRIAFFHFLPVTTKGFTAEERCLFSDDTEVLETFAQTNSLPRRIKRKITFPPLLDRVMDKNRYCSVWFRNLSIDGDANVGGCSCQLLDLSISGKFYERDDPWNGSYFQEMRKRFIDPAYPLPEPCTWCYNNSSHFRDWTKISNPLFRMSNRLQKWRKN
jgi:MoaA/NifB/PqqE/SkfB family radical SAM enzyme